MLYCRKFFALLTVFRNPFVQSINRIVEVKPNIRDRQPEVQPAPELAPGVDRGREVPVRVESPIRAMAHDGTLPTRVPIVQPLHTGQTAEPQLSQDVEAVLEDGLGSLYQSLDEATKREFKITGERTSSTIAQMLQRTHVQVRKVLTLIVSWLRIIPGISQLFIEQEAKIKTDRILELQRDRKGHSDD